MGADAEAAGGDAGDVVRRGMEEMFGPARWDRMPEFFAPEITLFAQSEPAPLVGYEQVGGFFKGIGDAFPDRTVTVDELIVDGDRVGVRWRMAGTHEGEFAGIPATGNRFSSHELSMYVVRDGRATEIHHIANIQGMLTGLKLMPPGPAPLPLRWVLAIAKRLPKRGTA